VKWGALVLVAVSVSAQNVTQPRPVLTEQLSHVSTDQRITTCEKLLAAKPGDRKLEIELTAAYLQKLRESADRTYLDRASKLVDKMLEADGGDLIAMRFENEIDLQRHDFKAVAERAQDMLKYAPADAGTWANLGDASMELGDYPQAGAAYIRMFSLRPDLASYNRLAWYRFVTGDAQVAIDLMRQAVDAGDPAPENIAWCRAELGDMYFKTGKVSEARSEYEMALETFPRLHRAMAGLGRVSAAQGRPQEAIQHYLQAQAVVPLPDYAAALEDLYTSAGLMTKAREQRAMITTIETLGRANSEKVNRNLALLLADHERDLPVALSLIETELPQRPDVYTWDAYAWILFKNHRLAEAQAASAKALRLNTPEPVFYYHAEQIAKASGDETSVHEYSARVTELNAKFDFAKTVSR
jgi:tetratricopeptide (TPR) repeat protein